MTHEISKKIKMLPMRYAIFYLYSTFIIFIFSDFAEQTDNLGEEFLFIFSACVVKGVPRPGCPRAGHH